MPNANGGSAMRRRRRFLPKILFLVILTAGLLAGAGTNAVEETSPSSCVTCHTDEKALLATLSKKKSKKSTHTSGTG